LLEAQDPEEVTRLGMIPPGIENLAIAALGVGELPTLVECGGLIKQFREIERL
jgi:hypothetical protein